MNLKKVYTHVPVRPRLTPVRMFTWGLAGSVLSPAYWLMAYRYRSPGLQFRMQCARMGLWLLRNPRGPRLINLTYLLLFWPMDSTRYFEFDFMWSAVSRLPITRYLDVSSPRLFPVILANKHHELAAELINPDPNDLAITDRLVRAVGLARRCRLHNCLIASAPFAAETFDIITSISVVEHIPEDRQAVEKMWTLLRSGGRLLVSVPCAAGAFEEYIDRNEFGLLTPDEHGFIFWQRFYDEALLEERIFDVTGRPTRMAVYGEKVPGAYFRDAGRKWADPFYPFWRAPYDMGQEYRYFERPAELPGVGVVAMVFVKG